MGLDLKDWAGPLTLLALVATVIVGSSEVRALRRETNDHSLLTALLGLSLSEIIKSFRKMPR
jgi:hypothetical protein